MHAYLAYRVTVTNLPIIPLWYKAIYMPEYLNDVGMVARSFLSKQLTSEAKGAILGTHMITDQVFLR
jgi:hypothetical protein